MNNEHTNASELYFNSSLQHNYISQLQQQQARLVGNSSDSKSNNYRSATNSNNINNNSMVYSRNQPTLMANSNILTLGPYKNRRDNARTSFLTKYNIIGYIASGTYGKVYKAKSKLKNNVGMYAIKKFKGDKEGEIVHYTGISQSACREMALCRELNNKNITRVVEIILEKKSIYMVFEYAEHDLLQIIHYHSHPQTKLIPDCTVKSILWQILNGVSFLHKNWIMHRDLKPANIMVSADGVVKIGDLGLARKFNNPLQSLYTGDKVVVTIWYRAPELLLGARHYTPAIDLWAVGCILAELLSLRPIFKGEEAKMDNKKNVPFQRNQMSKIIEILGTPTLEKWPTLSKYPEYPALQQFKKYPSNLYTWYDSTTHSNANCLQLLLALLEYDPARRVTAFDSLLHPYFLESPKVNDNVFEGSKIKYPNRRIHTDDNDIITSSQNNKRPFNEEMSMRKRQR